MNLVLFIFDAPQKNGGGKTQHHFSHRFIMRLTAQGVACCAPTNPTIRLKRDNRAGAAYAASCGCSTLHPYRGRERRVLTHPQTESMLRPYEPPDYQRMFGYEYAALCL